MKKLVLILSILFTCCSYAQELAGDDLQGFNLFVMPAPQINVQLSLDSGNIINPNTGFSVTPGVETIDMVALYNESQAYQVKPFVPSPNTDFGRLSFKSDKKGLSFSVNNNDRFARDFRNINPAFFEANRNTAFQRSYNPLSCYNYW